MKALYRMMLFTLVAAASLISSIAQAHTYCVSTASGLQDALSAAASNGENDTLLIEQGSYTGNFVYGSSEAFDVTVEGGYTISCADRVADPANTVLDGNFTGGVLALASSTVVHFSVEGVTIQNGAIANHGAGLYVSTEGTVTLTNNRVSGNTTGSGGSYHGGGIYVSSGSTVTLTNNTVSGNSSNYGGYANRGGGIYVYGGNGTVTLTNNTVSGNSVNSQGGGIYVSDSSAITLTSNLVSGNTVNGTGGGIYVNSHATLTNNTVSGNTASNTGGGIYVYSPYNFNSPVTLTMTNNTVSENTADYGGGLYYYCGYEFPIADIYNNIIWNNSAVVEGSDLYLNNDADNDYLPSLINVFNNDFDQSAVGTYVKVPFFIDPSNLDNQNPLFIDPVINSDYHLGTGSPCINSGDSNAPELPEYDMDGDARTMDSIVDIGADEYLTPTTKVSLLPVIYLLMIK